MIYNILISRLYEDVGIVLESSQIDSNDVIGDHSMHKGVVKLQRNFLSMLP